VDHAAQARADLGEELLHLHGLGEVAGRVLDRQTGVTGFVQVRSQLAKLADPLEPAPRLGDALSCRR
jgi:hypothetical protein